jgi:hypothetical protein
MVSIETQTYCHKLCSINTNNVAFHFLCTAAIYETQCGILTHIKEIRHYAVRGCEQDQNLSRTL